MNEQSKSHNARLRNNDYRFLKGKVLDIGCGPDPIKLPPPAQVIGWDLKDGDAQYLETLADNSFDAVVSSHCLEHMVDVPTSLKNWARVLKEGGYMLVTVPLYLCYEKWNDFTYPSKPSWFNDDHKSSWDLISVPQGVHNHPHYGFREINQMGKQVGLTIEDLRIETDNFDWSKAMDRGIDQTRGNALAQLCIVFLKA